MDITEDEESFVEEESPWDPNPDLVSFEFVKTGKSKGDGILTTNDNNFKVQYEKNQVTKKGDVTYYVCSEIRSGCQAKATVQRTESIDEEKQIEKKLVAVSKPMVNVIVGISKIQCFSRSMPGVTCQRMPQFWLTNW